jgi:membrane-bound serine protease (ClpP class)
MKKYLSFLLLISFIVFSENLYTAQTANYAVIELKGSINPVIAEYIVESIKDAELKKMSFIVIKLDTPGGFMEPMKDIIKAILNSSIPVVVYTYPKGAQAASAGGFIMLSAHVAAMSPGTEIGAMHPVSPMLDFITKDREGNPQGPMEKKVLNDTIAYGKSLAEERNRNINWVVEAIKNAKSSTYSEAIKEGIIDMVADDMNDLLKKLNNRTVYINKNKIVISSVNIAPFEYTMDWKRKFVNYLADPQIIFILFIIAVAGIGIEFKSPGLIVPGVFGGLSLILFLLGIKVISINIIGLFLLVLSIVLFILEFKIASYGLLSLAGIISFIIGAAMMFDSPLQGGYIPMQTIIGSALALFGIMFFLVRAVMKALRGKVTTGSEGMIGEKGTALKDFNITGKIFVHGEIWNAVSSDAIKKDDPVIVEKVNGMELTVSLYKK